MSREPGDITRLLLDWQRGDTAALDDLARVARRQARVVELRFFAGLTVPEAADVVGVSVATGERDWTAARHWLRRRLDSLAAGTV
jgi:DNA-directed RNA polymerase specialized sigma24 family protein